MYDKHRTMGFLLTGAACRLAMFAACIGLAAGSCHQCALGGQLGPKLQILLSVIGAGFALLRMASFSLSIRPTPEDPRTDSSAADTVRRLLAGADRAAAAIFSLIGIWFVALDMERSPHCWLCIAFWLGHYASVAADLASKTPIAKTAMPAFVLSTCLLLFAHADRITWTNLEAVSMTYLPVAETAHMAKVGDTVRADIVFGDKTELIIWTACPPCRKLASSGPLGRFVTMNPGYKFWVVSGAENDVPAEVRTRCVLVPNFFYESFGLRPDDPPVYATLVGHRITRIGLLRDYR